jgi:hypothetical protein
MEFSSCWEKMGSLKKMKFFFMKKIWYLIFLLAIVSCKLSKETQNNFPETCIFIERLDANYLILDEVNILSISVHGIHLNELYQLNFKMSKKLFII